MSRIIIVLILMAVIAVGIGPGTGMTNSTQDCKNCHIQGTPVVSWPGNMTPKQSENMNSFVKIAKENISLDAILISISILLGTFLDGVREGKKRNEIIADNKAVIALSIIIGLIGQIAAFFIALLVR